MTRAVAASGMGAFGALGLYALTILGGLLLHIFVTLPMLIRVVGGMNPIVHYRNMGEALLMALKDLAISTGSACTSASLEPSYVLRALGLDDDLAHSSLRFSFGRFTTEEEVDFAVATFRDTVNRLRANSPAWQRHQDRGDGGSAGVAAP